MERGMDDRNGRWALTLAACALGVALWSSLAPASLGGGGGDEVQAERFVVVDGRGRARAALGVADGRPVLELLDAGSGYAARLQSGQAGPELRFDGPAGQLRLGLGEVVRDGAGLSLYDADDRLRLGIALSRGTGTNFVLADASGRVRLALTVDTAGPYAALLDATGTPVWEAP